MIETTEYAIPTNPYASNPYEIAPKPPRKILKRVWTMLIVLALILPVPTAVIAYNVGQSDILTSIQHNCHTQNADKNEYHILINPATRALTCY